MNQSRFTEEQNVFAIKQAELSTSVPEVCRKLCISDATFTRETKYGRISPAELRHMRQRKEDNPRLKTLVADLSSEKGYAPEVLAK